MAKKIIIAGHEVASKAYVDEIKLMVETGSGIKVIEGSTTAPIIASELELGVYVISGTVQSSKDNTTSTEVGKRVYSIRRDDSTTILWEENPSSKTTNYVIFYHEGDNVPLVSSTIYASIDDVRTLIENATIDGGSLN